MLKAGVGSSVGVDAYREGGNAAMQAMTQMGDTTADVAIVFASVFYDQQKVLEGVRSIVQDAIIVGCSTAGEITTQGPSNKSSIAVMTLKSDKIKFYADVGEQIHYSPRGAGKSVAEKINQKAGGSLNMFMMFPDVLVGNGADIVRGVTDVLGENFPVVGGAAGDDFKFEKTFQYLNETVHTGCVVALGMKGPLTVGIGVKHGWIPIGIPRKVTKSQGSILYELDSKPAIGIYEEYFGQMADELRKEKLAKLAITYPLGMKVEGHDEMLLRDPIQVDVDGSITCAAEIPEGSEIQLMIGSYEEAVRVAEEAARNTMSQIGIATPKAIVIFNCIARHKLFGDRAGEEIKVIQSVIGKEIPLIGFYTYGEQAPLGGEVKNMKTCPPAFHNETVVICVLAE